MSRTPTPTPMPRNWDRVDAALAGVIAFADVDRLLARVDAALPLNNAEARQLAADAPPQRKQALRRLDQAGDLRDLSADALRAVQERHAVTRAEGRALWGRVFRLRVRLVWLKYLRPTLGAIWWALTALPRAFWWLGKLATRPFRRRESERYAPDRFRDDDDDFGPRRRFG